MDVADSHAKRDVSNAGKRKLNGFLTTAILDIDQIQIDTHSAFKRIVSGTNSTTRRDTKIRS
jgi:hypothetical protein